MAKLSIDQRYKIVILRKEGKSIKQIQDIVKCTKKVVLKWLKRYDDGESLNDKLRTGFKRKLNNEDESKLISIVESNKLATRSEIINKLKKNICKSTITNYLKRNNYSTYRAAVQPLLKPFHKRNRVHFCSNNVNLDLSNVVPSDE